ncbi:MAG: nicotinate-nucleotide--dimethylbenzimidazole phosphoribosyltransferase [Pseudomonadota bacterium]
MSWWLSPVKAVCTESAEAARARQVELTKPPGSLGILEDLAVAFAGWQGVVKPQLNSVEIAVFAADHGVVDAGVSAFPKSVTGEMIRNFATGGAAISVLARSLGARFSVLNLGTANPLGPLAGVRELGLAPGTANFCESPAMSEDALLAALGAGQEAVSAHSDLFIGGEMGIGNTTSAAALASVILNLPPETTVGRGTGIDDDGLERKRAAVEAGLALHKVPNDEPLTALRCLGGLEIAGLLGAYIACAQRGIPVLVDGYIASAAALLACSINAGVRDWLLFGHRSAEPGHRYILDHLKARPLLDLEMRLGEGSGAAVAVPLLHSALALHNGMATFAEAAVSEKQVP